MIAWRPGCGQGREERLEDKRGTRTFGGGAGFVHCLDCGDGFIGLYICQNLSNCIL